MKSFEAPARRGGLKPELQVIRSGSPCVAAQLFACATRLVVRGGAAPRRQHGDGQSEGEPQLWRSSRTRAFLPTLPRR